MKKTLLLVRHAKAEDQSKMFKDFDRELVGQGIMESARLGHYLKVEGVTIEHMLTSSAARAYQTVKVIAEQLKFDVDRIETSDKLYSSGPHAYLAMINTAPESISTLLLCGHNPDITYFAEYLTHADVGSMEKGSLLAIEFEGLSWAEIAGKTGTIKKRISPKSLKELDSSGNT
jgi:phosphohistidine phosphatase